MPSYNRIPGHTRPSLFLIAMILLVVFSACNPTAPETQPAGTERPQTPAPATQTQPATRATFTPSPTATPAARITVDAARLQGTTIRFWHPWSGSLAETLQALVTEFNRSNEHQITVDIASLPGGWDDLEGRLTGALETGEPPDLAAGFVSQASRWEMQGRVVDLEPYFLDTVWGLEPDAEKDFYPAVWAHGLAGSRRAAAPLLPTASVLIYNASWAQELGYRTPPTSIQQFADQACTAADSYRKDSSAENDGMGGLLAVPDHAAAINWIYAFGGEFALSEDAERGRAYAFNQAEAEEAFTFLRELYDDGCVWASDQVFTEDAFARRLALFTTSDLFDLPYAAQSVQRTGSRDRWAVIPYPSNEGENSLSIAGPGLIVFKSTSERQLAAWLLARWLLEPSNHARLVQASGAFPLRQAELPLLEAYRIANPQWSMALALLPGARPEPVFASWGEVRWALSDAFTQLFRSYFQAQNIPKMLEYLDEMSAELHTGELPEDLFTPVPSPTSD